MSRQRFVLVANSLETSLTTFTGPASGELSILSQSPNGTLAQIVNTGTVGAFPRMNVILGKGTGYAPDVVPIEGKGVVAFSNAAYSVGSRKSIVAGYNGISTETLPVNLYSSYEYGIRITPADEDNEGTKWEPSGFYKSYISAYNTPASAHGRYTLLKNLMTEINTDTNLDVTAKIRQSETCTACGMAVTVVNGSNAVTGTGLATACPAGTFLMLAGDFYKVDSTYSTTTCYLDRVYAGISEVLADWVIPAENFTMVAGSTLATAAGAHGLTGNQWFIFDNAAYYCSYLSATEYTLDRPYEGTDTSLTKSATPGAGLATVGAAGYVAGATVDADTLFGIHFEADNYNESFDAKLEEGFDADEVIARNTMAYQVGTYAEVLEQSQWSDPAFGTMNKTFLPDTRVNTSTSGNTYDKWSITFNNYIQGTDGTGRNHSNDMELVIYMKSDVSTSTQLYDYLQDWLLSCPNASGAWTDI